MKGRRLIELVSLPQPEAARFEPRPDGGTTLMLEMDLLTQDDEISMDVGLIRGEPVQLIAVRQYPSKGHLHTLSGAIGPGPSQMAYRDIGNAHPNDHRRRTARRRNGG